MQAAPAAKSLHDGGNASASASASAASEATVTAEQRHAIAVAVASAAAAEAAVVTAQAAVEVARLAREHHAAVVIQTAFRGYLVSREIQISSHLSLFPCAYQISFINSFAFNLKIFTPLSIHRFNRIMLW